MNEVHVLMRMGQNGEDGEMLCAFPSRAAAEVNRKFRAKYEDEDMLQMEIFTVDFSA